MALTNREVAVLGILVCCVPFQLWLSKLSSLTAEEKGMRIQGVLIENRLQIQALLSPSLWVIWLKETYRHIFIKDYSYWYHDDEDPLGECPAVEVLKFRHPKGHFATSVAPRDFRPQDVKFRVGQVVQHKKHKYVGVVVGWDKTCKAPDAWMKLMHGTNYHYRLQPNYAILIDERNRSNRQATYIVQENLEAVRFEAKHPKIKDYFDSYDGSQYLPQPWLRALYPLD